MSGQHWGERDGKPSTRENAIVGIGCTVLAISQFGGLLLLAVGLLRAETCTITKLTDGHAGAALTTRLNAVDALETVAGLAPNCRRPALQPAKEISK